MNEHTLRPTGRPVRVVQSFTAPRDTTNPYITMLDAALTAEPGIDAHRFSWKQALLGRYDVFHWHWPESRMVGSSPLKAWVKTALTAALWARHRLSRRIAVVTTVHNLELPDTDPVRRWVLQRIAARADFAITLNETTTPTRAIPYRLIPHGHYRDWYGRQSHAEQIPGRIGSFGQIRRYKGLDALLAAYRAAAARDTTTSLRVGGKPTSADLGASLTEQTRGLPRLHLDLRFLDDADLVRLVTESQLIVLAYRFMHNSGSALAALSLDRPVLVPRNAVNERLAAEVGEGWVHQYDGDVDADDLLGALAATATLAASDERPDLGARDWDRAGREHLAAYRDALLTRRGR